jgi:PKD repeat protein
MKKIITTFLVLCISMLSFAQTVTTTISGTVTNTSTGLPVSGQAVYIMTDSSNTTFSYYNVVYTNPNGYYADTLTIPDPSQIIFYVSTSNCNGAMITNYVVSSTLPMISNFTITCGGNPSGCQAYFYMNSDSMNSGLGFNYYFTDQSTSGSPITSWAWDFGDGATSTLQNPTHVYTSIGLYNICLTIASDSCTDTYCDSIYVDTSNTTPCYASFQYSITNYDVAFYGYSNNTQVIYSWDFGDGSPNVTGQNITHTYFPGTYTACLTAYNSNGCFDQYCETLFISDSSTTGCPASFVVYPDSVPGQYSYYFINTSPGANTGYNFYWSFGDGSSSTDINPVHTFPGFGTYTVCLHVLDDSTGLTLCSYCNTIVVDSSNTSGCYAYFGWNCSNDGSVYFYDYSNTNIPSDVITSWTWDFGDGSSSTDQNPIHYFGNGLFNVCLAITTTSSCSSTYCDYIQTGNVIDSTYCDLYVMAISTTNESSSGASDGAIDIEVYGGTGPYTYSWSNGAITQDISGLTAGYYDVLVTDNSGLLGCQTWATFEILDQSDSSNWGYIDTLNTTPIDSCFNFSIGYAYIYSWTFIDNTTIEITWIVYDTQGLSTGFVTTVYTFGTIGNYQFSVTIICGSAKGTHVFYDDLYIMNTAGVSEITDVNDQIVLYPNPATDVLNIGLNDVSGSVTVNISNATGQIVRKMSSTIEANQKLTVNTASLPEGLYFVQVNCNGKMITGRFVK